jgi:hypothetical protein
MVYNMLLLAEFDLPSTLANYGGMGVALYILYEITRAQLKTFAEQMAIERERADTALKEERRRAAEAIIDERSRSAAHLLDERKVWTGAVRQITARLTSLDSTVKKHFDPSQANNGHSDD